MIIIIMIKIMIIIIMIIIITIMIINASNKVYSTNCDYSYYKYFS